jgi:hypothetical protein
MNAHELSLIVEQETSDTTHCIFVAYEPNSDSVSHCFTGRTNTAYNCIISYLNAHPEHYQEIRDAVNDFKVHEGTPHQRPE